MLKLHYETHPGRVRLTIEQLPLVEGFGTTVEEAAADLVDDLERYLAAYLNDPDGYFCRGGSEHELPYVLAAKEASDAGALTTFVFAC